MPAASRRCCARLVGGLDALTRHYEVRICYYEDFRNLTAGYVNALLAWMGSDARIRPATAAELARQDAQEGSIMSRASVGDVRTILLFERPSATSGARCGRQR